MVNLDPVISIVGRTEQPVAISAGKERAIGSSQKRIDAIPRVQAIVNRLPAITIVSRSKYTDRTTKRIAACENISARVDGQRKKCGIWYSSVECGPIVSVVGRTKRAASKCSGEDAIAGIDRQRSD